MGLPCFASIGYASGLTMYRHGFAYGGWLHLYTSSTTHWRGCPPASPHRLATIGSGSALATPRPRRDGKWFGRLASPVSPGTRSCGYGNINPLSIDYACRPRLRSRLTLGGLAWPRNPWSFGGGVSHSPFATHACILTRAASTTGSPRRFARRTTLPYPSTRLRTPMNGSADLIV